MRLREQIAVAGGAIAAWVAVVGFVVGIALIGIIGLGFFCACGYYLMWWLARRQ